MFNLNSKAEKIFCMKQVQMQHVLAEEVAAVKNRPSSAPKQAAH